MAGYLLWIPTEERIETDAQPLLARAGLLDLLRPGDALPVAWQAYAPEPEGDRHGQLITFDEPGRPGPQAALLRDRQTWRRLTPRDGLQAGRGWVGWFNDAKPGPADLVRKKPHPGEPVKLCDGEEWQIPTMRHLPQAMAFEDDGQVAMRYVDQAYASLAERVADAYRRMVADMQAVVGGETLKAEFPLRELLYLGADLLGLNYRVNVDLVGALQLLGNESMGVLFAAAGAPRDWWAEKKSAESMKSGDAA